MTKTAQYSRYGEPGDVIEIVEIDHGPLNDDEVRIHVEVVPVNLDDLYYMRNVLGFHKPLPAIPGNRGVGKIIEVGLAITDFRVGDRVYLPPWYGTWQQQMKVTTWHLFRAPADGDPVQLALAQGNLMTSYFALKDIVPVDRGEWIIQNGANSSCGGYIIQLAKMWGIKTVNIVRRPEVTDKLNRLGADVVVVDGPDLAVLVAAATDNAKIRLGIDMVAGDATTRMAECLAEGGTIGVYGYVSEEPCKIPVALLLSKDIRLHGFFSWRSLERRPLEVVRAYYDEMSDLVVRANFRSEIAAVYPLEQLREAVAHESRSGSQRPGKVMLAPNGVP